MSQRLDLGQLEVERGGELLLDAGVGRQPFRGRQQRCLDAADGVVPPDQLRAPRFHDRQPSPEVVEGTRVLLLVAGELGPDSGAQRSGSLRVAAAKRR